MKPFNKESGPARILGNEAGSSRQQLLLLLLLVLVGAFAYLYFFTGLIVPREQTAKAPPAAVAPEKKPLPPRPEQAATKEAAPAKGVSGPATTTAKVEPAKQTPPPAKPEPAKPAAAPAKPAAPAARPEPAKTAAAPAKPAAVPAKPASVAKVEPGKAPAAKPLEKKPTAPVKEAAKQGTPAAQAAHGSYRLLIGDVAAEEVSKVKATLKKLGITPVVEKHVKSVKPMNRLFVAEYAEHSGADAELQRVRKSSADAFILPAGEKFAVYAGSYLSEQRALSEKKRLGTQGVKSTIQKTKVSVPLVRMMAGNFTDSAAAAAAGKRLHKHGITAKVMKKG